MKTHQLINEEKIPEFVLEKLDLRFSQAQGKFSSATYKFISVRDTLISQTVNADIKRILSRVTPAMFFQYKKGNRSMIAPEPTVDKKPPTTSTRPRKEIPYDLSDNDEFETLSQEVADEHTIPEIMTYYKNMYYNVMPTNELAKKIAFAHFSHTDDVNLNDVVKMLNDAKVDDGIKLRIPDDKILEKSKSHFGFENESEIIDAMKNDYADVVEKDRESILMKKKVSPNSTPNEYHRTQFYRNHYNSALDSTLKSLINAYLERNAQSLERMTKTYQILEYLKGKRT